MIRRHVFAVAGLLLAFLALAASRPAPAWAQGAGPAVLGGAAGLLAGGYVSVGIWTAKARWRDEYMYAPRDALGWEAAPVAVGAVAGTALGLTDRDRLRRAAIGGAVGWLVGTGIGATLGAKRWRPPEGRWAGGVIGGAAGLVVGAAVGALLPGGDDGSGTGPGSSPALPLAFTIRF